LCKYGKQLRPDVVWFGEEVPMMSEAYRVLNLSDCLIVIGTSLQVYPAAYIIYNASPNIPKFIIDPQASQVNNIKNLKIICKKAGEGTPELVDYILKNGF